MRVTGPFGAAITGENLVATALARLAKAEPGLVLGAVTLDKRLPVAAGIGGGSADAAALLRAVARANPARADSVDWGGIAASLGADVPVCLASAPALVWGVGDKMTMLPGLPSLAAVLANPLVPLPPDKTKRVFARLSAPPAPPVREPPLVSPTRIQTADGARPIHARGGQRSYPRSRRNHACHSGCAGRYGAVAGVHGGLSVGRRTHLFRGFQRGRGGGLGGGRPAPEPPRLVGSSRHFGPLRRPRPRSTSR